MRRECLEKTELERSKFEIRNSEVGMEPTPSSYRPEQTKRKTHPFKNQNRKGRAPRQEKTNSKSFRQVQSVSHAGGDRASISEVDRSLSCGLREEAEEADHEVGGVGEDEVSVGATRRTDEEEDPPFQRPKPKG